MSQEGREQESEPRVPAFSSAGITHREVGGVSRTESGLGALDMLPKRAVPFSSLLNVLSSHLTENISVFYSKTLYKRFSKYSIHLFKALLYCLLWWVSGEIIRYLLSPFHLAKAVPLAPM